jgi:hypothetical protein
MELSADGKRKRKGGGGGGNNGKINAKGANIKQNVYMTSRYFRIPGRETNINFGGGGGVLLTQK